MLLGRAIPACAIALLAVACEPTIAYTPPPASVVTAVFDPTTGQIPVPNDLILQQDPTTLGLPAAQVELLRAFAQHGGFPNDQEVSVTLDFKRTVIHDDGTTTTVAPQLDLSSFTPDTLIVYGATAAGPGLIAIDPLTAGDYVTTADRGTLTLHNKDRMPWAPGQYMVLVRGGENGVRTVEGEPVYASQTFYLIAQGEDLTSPRNIGLIRAQTQTMAQAQALARQLNAIIGFYQPVFAVADSRFPHQELAVLTTFGIQPAVTQVELDPARGLVPLPIDLLRNPVPGGKLTNTAACALAQEPEATCLDASGRPQGAAAGFAALDGFSTTAPLLAATNGLVQASTVNATTVFLYDLTEPAAPVLVNPSTVIYGPCEFASSGLTPVVALQPAGATACDATSVFRTRPLKDATDYALVITDGVKDKTGKAMGPGTVGRILLFDNPLIKDGASQLQGVDAPTAGALEVMRQQLIPVQAQVLADKSVSRAHIAMAYTFHTQSFLKTAASLGALPYVMSNASALPGAVVSLTPAAAFTKYGVDPTKVPKSHIQEVLETTIATFNLLDPATGAFRADQTPAAETIQVLIAVPKLPGLPPLVAPMMIFRHGLGGGRADMLAVADSNAAKGLVTVAIDAAKHGDRSFCAKGSTTTTVNGTSFFVCQDHAACVSPLPSGAQGDAAPPGTCANGFAKRPVSSSCIGNVSCAGETDGISLASSSFLITSNFFRTRDTFRQDQIDQSQLVRAIAFPPPSPVAATGYHTVFDHLLGEGVIIDAGKVYFSGQSLGAITGTLDVASNPRISKAVLNVGGGTLVDVFTNSPAFKDGVLLLLSSLGITPGTAGYLQFLSVAKLILDPADPVNYAGHITAHTLPNLLPPLGGAVDGSVAQAPKKLLTQLAFCDQVVPNPFSFVWASTAGVSPLLIAPTFGGPGTFQLFYTGSAAPTASDLGSCPAPGDSPLPAGAVDHAFFTNWDGQVQTGRAQSDAAAFVTTDTLPNSLVVLRSAP